ncbi:uncharacterized protein LOC107496528 [Arachis duranensis]|uniref:Uncharacterized protein LOC107496528 n=1 Tax=Arachis duranensis TaxID=130453 RepID=A0A6P4E464_ARADU|nr:uncharacterized protein LOC107496528 [Arachis duranensis]
MALSADHPFEPVSTTACSHCEAWKKKCSKLQESRNALRQAVKLLETKINEVQAQNVKLSQECEEERARAKAEAEEKLKECNARVSLENEVCSLRSEIDAIRQKPGGDAKNGNESIEGFQGCIADKEKEISRLKELLEAEKKKADKEKKNSEKERKKAAEALKAVEAEKSKSAEKEMQIAKVEAEKVEEYRTRLVRLEKEANEAKTKLASQVSASKEATKRFEAEKRKILAGKRDAELGMTKAKEMLETERGKVTEEKKRADSEMVKAKEQKALAESNWRKFIEEKQRADEMSHQVERDKQTIEELKKKISELLSVSKPVETAGVPTAKAEDTSDVKLLKSQLKLEKLRAKYARQKFKLEASRCNSLHQELGRIKTDFVQLLRRLDMLDASFSSFPGRHEQTKSGNMLYMQNSDITRQVCNINLSPKHSELENELLQTCCTTMDTCDPLRKDMHPTQPLAPSSGNYSESIPGIDSKLKPLSRGPNRTKLQRSAVNSNSESFSDGQLMGSQETTAFPVSASAKLDQEILNARQIMCNSSERYVTENHRKRKRTHANIDSVANLSSQNLSNLHGLLYREEDKCLEGGRDVLPNQSSIQKNNDRANKKKKKSHSEKVVTVPSTGRVAKKGIEEAKANIYGDANVSEHISCPGSQNLEITPAGEERICDAAQNLEITPGEVRTCGAANSFDSLISLDKMTDETYMKFLELDNAAYEQRYRRAVDSPLSPSLPEIEFHKTFEDNSLKKPFLEEALQEGMSSRKADLFPSPGLDGTNFEISSNNRNLDSSSDSRIKPTQASKTEVVKLPHMHTSEISRASFLAEDEIGPLHKQPPKICAVFSNIEDHTVLSRMYFAIKACMARCSLDTQTVWAVGSILTALKKEETLSKKEKVSVLLTLMLFNFVMASTSTFGNLCDGNIFCSMNSYAQHIRTAMLDAETRILLIETCSFLELLGLIEDFLIEGKVLVENTVPAEASADHASNDSLDGISNFSSEVATSEQLLAGSIILSSICAATDHVGFICEASYRILRLCKWDSLMLLTILHIFAYLGGEKFFDVDNFGSMVTVLKSLVIFLEDESKKVSTSYLPSIDQLHTEFCTSIKCPFLEGAESIDSVSCLLLEEIKYYRLQRIEQVALSDSGFMPENFNGRQCSNPEAVQKAYKSCDGPCSWKRCTVSSAAQPGVLGNVDLCCLGDVLSLVELVAKKMGWHWSDIKLVPQLLDMLDSGIEESFGSAIIVLLGQLGRIGVDAAGYEDRGVENLRYKLFAFLDHTSSVKARNSLQISAVTSLFGLLPLDPEALVCTEINLPAYSKSISDHAQTLRKWSSGLDKDDKEFLSTMLRPQ